VAHWDGSPDADAVTVQATTSEGTVLGASHFGSGILTFHVNALFRTEPGYDLLVTGPFNQPKDAIQPMTGIVETDWSPFTFTMNWKFTRKFSPVSFERDEAFCMIFPLQRGAIEQVEPEIRPLARTPMCTKPIRRGQRADKPSMITSRSAGLGQKRSNGRKITSAVQAALVLPQATIAQSFA
jgi:hypothetical protein